jgi:hypothetical protein
MRESMGLLAAFALGAVAVGCSGATDAAGTWTGRTTGEASDSPRIRFIIVDRDGALTGTMLFEDPETHEFLEPPDIIGDRNGDQLTWRTASGTVITGVIEGNAFRGIITYRAKPEFGLAQERYGLELER